MTELKRHECARNGPCSDNGDGCSCSDAELARRPSPSISEVEVKALADGVGNLNDGREDSQP